MDARLFYALRYAVTTEAGSLPRSLTVNPFWRAQERTSALLGDSEPADRCEVSRFDDAERALVDAAGRTFLAAAGFFLAVFLSFDGLLALVVSSSLAPCWSLETTSVTPYKAPRTRTASSRGSLESRVSLKPVAFRHNRGPAAIRQTTTLQAKDRPSPISVVPISSPRRDRSAVAPDRHELRHRRERT